MTEKTVEIVGVTSTSTGSVVPNATSQEQDQDPELLEVLSAVATAVKSGEQVCRLVNIKGRPLFSLVCVCMCVCG